MTEEKPPALPDSAEALRSKIADLEKDRDADRAEIARLKVRLDALDEEVIAEVDGEDEDDMGAYA